jgi:hypothetical protein
MRIGVGERRLPRCFAEQARDGAEASVSAAKRHRGFLLKVRCELAELSWFSGIRVRSRKPGHFRAACYLVVTYK